MIKPKSYKKILIISIPIILFFMLAALIQTGITTNFEGWVYNEAVENMNTQSTIFFKMFTRIGDPIFIVSLCLILMFFSKTRHKIGIPVSITVIVSAFINIVLKSVFARERPNILRLINETSYSFPSGHAMINSALYIILILILNNEVKSKKIRIIGTFIGIFLILIIGLSRIYLGVHYASDVLGGFLLGFVISLIVYDRYKKGKYTL